MKQVCAYFKANSFCIGYLVRIITLCIADMKVFLFIFLTVIVAFNEAFFRIHEASPPEG